MKVFFFVTTIASYLGISLACTCISSTQRSTWCSADWGFHDEYHTLTINYCTFMRLPLNDNYFGGPPEWTLVDNNLLAKLRNKNFLPCSPKNFSATFQKLFDDFFDKLERSLNK
uniref:Uncharacterized protein n=1 Tax=Acrobeloides nanus TaxID=290746 RepID=A0A914EHI7_9BILA